MREEDDFPAAKLVATNDYASARRERFLGLIVNRVLSFTLLIFLTSVYLLTPRAELEEFKRVLYVPYGCAYVIQFISTLQVQVAYLESRRSQRKIGLLDASRYSADWEDKFVGIYKLGTLSQLQIVIEMVEPALWAGLFMVLFMYGSDMTEAFNRFRP